MYETGEDTFTAKHFKGLFVRKAEKADKNTSQFLLPINTYCSQPFSYQ